MIVQVFAVRDSKAALFSQPWFSVSVASAVRAFTDAVNDGKGDFGKHPDDYTLFHIGTFDDQGGVVAPLEHGPMSLGLAAQFVLPPDRTQLSLLGGSSA